MNKKLALAGAAVIASIAFWWVAEGSVKNIQLRDPIFWIKNIFALGLYVGFLINFLAVAEPEGHQNHGLRLVTLVFVIQAIFYFFIFYDGQGFRLYSLGGLLLVLAGLSYYKSIDKEKHESIKISLSRIANKRLSFLILILALLLSFGYFFTPKVQEKSEKFEVPLSYRNLILSISQEILLRSAPREFREQYQNLEVREQIEKEVEKSSDQTFSAFENSLKPYLKFLPIFLFLGFWLTLLAFTFLWKWIALLFSSIIFIILRKTDFITINKVVIEKEVLEIK